MDLLAFVVITVSLVSSLKALYRYGDVDRGAAFPCRCKRLRCYPDNGTCSTDECKRVKPPGFKWSGEGCRIGNVALGRPAFHSVTYKNRTPDMAVDGNIGPRLRSHHCSYTGSNTDDTPAWWYVDLGCNHVIYNVTIYNMDNQYYEIMSDFHIKIGNETRVSENPVCGSRIPTVPQAGNATITCQSPMYGRYVGYQSLKPRSDDNARWVSICEFVVIGRTVVDCTLCSKHCDDYHGCDQCENGTLIPDCKRSCPSGKYGINCAATCSVHCNDSEACDNRNGRCQGGCTDVQDYVRDEWWIGDRCDVYVPKVPVSPIENITTLGRTAHSVTIQWADTLNLSESIHRIFGYNVYFKTASKTWTWHGNMPYSSHSGGKYSLFDIEAGTTYEITLSIFRNFTDGTEYQTEPGLYPSQIITVTTLPPVYHDVDVNQGAALRCECDGDCKPGGTENGCRKPLYRYGDVNQGAAFPCRCDGDCYPDNGNCITGACQDVNPPGFTWSGDGCRIGNVALGRPASHTYTYTSQPAGLAVDGKIGPGRESGECSYTGSTSYDTPAWWYVDLGSVHVIYNVTIYNFDDRWYKTMSNFEIRIGNETTVSMNEVCRTRIQTVLRGWRATITCPKPMYGRYAGYRSLKPSSDYYARWVSICEFVVIGRIVIDCSLCPRQTHCDDYHGCDQCGNGTRIPDCKRSCLSGKYGINCAANCSEHCINSEACDKNNGTCQGGCKDIQNHVRDEWWIGDRCDIHVPTVPESPITHITASVITTHTVTIEWTDNLNISESINHIFGFTVYFKTERTWWTLHGKSPYRSGRQYYLFDLEEGTSYQITLSIYRNFTDGTEYQTELDGNPSQVITVTTLSHVNVSQGPCICDGDCYPHDGFVGIKNGCRHALYRYGDVSQGAAFPCRCDGDCYPDNGTCITGECQDVQPPGFKWSGEGCRLGNVALGQPAFHTHTYDKRPAELAVDGKTGPGHASVECSYTGSTSDNTPAWWYVDLGSLHVIYYVTVYNFQDHYHYIMSNFEIKIGNETTVTKNRQCGTRRQNVSSGGNATIPCSEPMYGRYAGYHSLKPPSDYNARWVSICEFVVFGRSVVDCSQCPGDCDDYYGCEQCKNGTLIPDCKRGCTSGQYGINCIEHCSLHCMDPQACDKGNGTCYRGCTDVQEHVRDEWWIGERCDVYVPTVPVSPIVNFTAPVVTSNAVTIQWENTLNIPGYIHHLFGYNIYFKNDSGNWTWHGKLPYKSDMWTQYSLENLEEEYTLEITPVIFRIFTDGTEYQKMPGDDLSQVINVTTLSRPTTTASPQSVHNEQVNVGGVVGGLMGGFVVIGVAATVVIVVILRYRRVRKEHSNDVRKSDDKRTTNNTTDPIGIAMTDKKTYRRHIEETEDQVSIADEDVGQIYENTNPRALIANTAIQIKNLERFLDGKKTNQTWFSQEYKALPEGQVLECKIGSRPINIDKNRYKNILPYDATIIELEAENDQTSTYINANFVTGFGGKKYKYAATQGPKPGTINDFWRLIWTLQSSRIVMLTALFESCKNKCALYWLEDVGLSKEYGSLKVTTMQSDHYAEYIHRVFKLEKQTNHVLMVHHYQYLLWPDKSVPKERYPLIALRNFVRSQDEDSTGPLVVHCSAGVGRTGTFIAIDCLMEQAESDNEIDVVKLVTQMRLERMLMIQTLSQYVFVYDALLDATTCGRTAVTIAALEKEQLGSQKPDHTNHVEQFKLLSKLREENPQINSVGRNPENVGLNRDSSIVPNNEDRPILAMTSSFKSDYINAVFINSFKVKRGMIATQTPLADTVVDFWRLVYDHNCDVIVMLDDKVNMLYWEEEINVSQDQGPFEIVLNSVKKKNNLILRKFNLSKKTPSQTRKSPRGVHHIHFTGWNQAAKLPDKRSLLDLFDHIDSIKPKKKLLVHCLNGASRCGLFCAARYMLEKMAVELVADPFTAVRYVSSVRRQFVDNIEQYLYLHGLALEFNSRFAIYENI